MASKWLFTRPDGPYDYPSLGFTASTGDILDATSAPDAYWSLNGNQSAAETVKRHGTAVDSGYTEPTDGYVLAWSDAANAFVPTRPATGGGGDSFPVTTADATGVADATAAIQAVIEAASTAGGGRVMLPPGRFKLATPLVPRAKVSIIGAGRAATVLLPYGTEAAFKRLGTTVDLLDDAHFADFGIDGSNQASGSYVTSMKGIYIQYLRRCTFKRLRIVNTGATGLGTDFHVDCVMDDVIADGCGRLNDGTGGGGAGIGIGTGAFATETLNVVNCVTRNNKRCGLFFESQNGGLPLGFKVIGHWSEGNGEHGIADAGTIGIEIIGGTSRTNGKSGFAAYQGTIAPATPGTYGVVDGLDCQSNTENGVHLDWSGRVPSQCRYIVRSVRARANSGHGILVQVGATDVSILALVDNEIGSNQKAGIYVLSSGGSLIDATIADNRIFANGLNTGAAERQGIRINANTTRLKVTGNRAWDAQGTPTQTYGLQLSGTFTHSSGFFDGNDFRLNATGAVNNAATLGSFSVLGANNAGWTVAAGAPAIAAPVGTTYRRTDGGAGTTLYVKESATDATGWVAK